MTYTSPFYLFLAVFAAFSLNSCKKPAEKPQEIPTDVNMIISDPHSFAEPNKAIVRHLDLTATVDFNKKVISGIAGWDIENRAEAEEIIFDTRGLIILGVTEGKGKENEKPLKFALGESPSEGAEFMGKPLHVKLNPETKRVNISYETTPGAEALQWLEPVQTAGKKQPYLFTQGQAILTRTWIPCQDSPGIRFTYAAQIQVPPGLMALMSAENPEVKNESGSYTFKMEQPIPAYLMALAVGNLAFGKVGPRTGVYAEPSMLEASVYEFGEMEAMLSAAEGLYGAYRWGRYDLIVLPPSFPFGGMENPRLTFATPTILAGDRSLTSLVAHELAHSWSGNLVTNATWDDFWLNEGFTVYFERRIMEVVQNKSYVEMLSLLGYQDLEETVADLGEKNEDTHLKLNLKGRNPDDGMTDIAYEKGNLLLRTIEETVGREKFDAFLKKYFSEHAFKVMTTEAFVEYLDKELIGGDQELSAKLRLNDWIYGPGIPDNHVKITAERFVKVDEALTAWKGGTKPGQLETEAWTTHEWLHFIRNLSGELSLRQMEELDNAFGFTKSGNSEIQAAWFMHAIEKDYQAAFPALESFLMRVGRRKFLKPLYQALAQTEKGKTMALKIYSQARPNYHSVSTNTLDELLGYGSGS